MENKKAGRPKGIKKYHTEEERKEASRLYMRKCQAKRSKIKIDCYCGGHYDLTNKDRHFKTFKHTSYTPSKNIDFDFNICLF